MREEERVEGGGGGGRGGGMRGWREEEEEEGVEIGETGLKRGSNSLSPPPYTCVAAHIM